MYKSTEKGTRKVMSAIGYGLFRYGTLTACRDRVGEILSAVPWLDGRSRADILNEAMAVARAGLLLRRKAEIPSFCSRYLDGVMKAWNRAYKRLWVRTRDVGLKSAMKLQRGREDPVVFYLVSSHQDPQPAHAPLQGKVLVDYYWRSTLEGDIRLGSVAKYVRNRKIRTVQWATGAPHYLCSRPNCRHYLIPLKTNDVLSFSVREIREKYQPKRTGVHRPLTDAQRAAAYAKLKRDVYSDVQKKTGL